MYSILLSPAEPPMSIFCKLVALRRTPDIKLREGSYAIEMSTSPFELDYKTKKNKINIHTRHYTPITPLHTHTTYSYTPYTPHTPHTINIINTIVIQSTYIKYTHFF